MRISFLKVSRLGRFALRTKRELHTSPGAEECSSHVGGARGVSNSSQSEVQVEIVRTVLVFRPTGERRRDTNGDNGMTYNGLKNFKKFRKVLMYVILITLHAYARGKVIGFVHHCLSVVCTKIARSRDLGI